MKPRILVVATTPPLPATSGGNQRTNLLMRALSRVAEVALVTLTTEDRLVSVLPELCDQYAWMGNAAPLRAGEVTPWRWIRPMNEKFVDRLAHNILGLASHALVRQERAAEAVAKASREFSPDLIVARYLNSAVVSDAFRWAPVLIDIDDHPLSVYETRLRDPRMRGIRAWIVRRHLAQLGRVVPDLIDQAAAVFLANAEDRRYFGARRESAVLLPNIVYTDNDVHPSPLCMQQSEPATVLVVGSWSHRPNADGVNWFLENAWPSIRASRSDARLRIVGSRLSDAHKRRWSVVPGVEVVGFVDNLEEEYRRARLTVCTQFEGGGTKIKVLESLAFGRPVVLTPHAHRGYEATLPDGQCLLVAPDGSQTTEACLRLMNDIDLASSLAARGAEAVRQHYSFSRFAELVSAGVECALRTRGRHE